MYMNMTRSLRLIIDVLRGYSLVLRYKRRASIFETFETINFEWKEIIQRQRILLTQGAFPWLVPSEFVHMF